MPNIHVVRSDDLPVEPVHPAFSTRWLIIQLTVGVLVLFGLGTWLVWWSASVQRMFTLEDIRSSCQRVMPETVERCVDTVIIQRGGARR